MTPVQAAPFGLPIARLALRRVAVQPGRPSLVFAFFEELAERGRQPAIRPERPAPKAA